MQATQRGAYPLSGKRPVPQAPPPDPTATGSRGRSRVQRREARAGFALILPALVLVGTFILFPLGFAVYISLTNWPLIGPYHFIGLANYASLVHNATFLHSVLFTLLYTAIVTLPILVIGYFLAMFVRSNRRGATVFRTCFFLPFIVGLTTLSFLAVVELQPSYGTVNVVLSALHIASINTGWTVHTGLALAAICVLVVWLASGLTMMLLMAGMQSVPSSLYESADVDGATFWQKERLITLPLLRRSIALSLILSVVGSFLAFNQFYIITDGGPGTSTFSVVMEIYQTFNTSMQVGLASAMSIVLMIVVGALTSAQFRLLEKKDA